jgi:hypothetical protein
MTLNFWGEVEEAREKMAELQIPIRGTKRKASAGHDSGANANNVL